LTKLLDLDASRRDALLNAALKEFSIQGYDNASTNVIAKEAGISKALMFHYVSSKQELFFWVYDYFDNLMKKEYFEILLQQMTMIIKGIMILWKTCRKKESIILLFFFPR